jgi:hypothetical protein
MLEDANKQGVFATLLIVVRLLEKRKAQPRFLFVHARFV